MKQQKLSIAINFNQHVLKLYFLCFISNFQCWCWFWDYFASLALTSMSVLVDCLRLYHHHQCRNSSKSSVLTSSSRFSFLCLRKEIRWRTEEKKNHKEAALVSKLNLQKKYCIQLKNLFMYLDFIPYNLLIRIQFTSWRKLKVMRF